jgi:hypothetical protein
MHGDLTNFPPFYLWPVSGVRAIRQCQPSGQRTAASDGLAPRRQGFESNAIFRILKLTLV